MPTVAGNKGNLSTYSSFHYDVHFLGNNPPSLSTLTGAPMFDSIRNLLGVQPRRTELQSFVSPCSEGARQQEREGEKATETKTGENIQVLDLNHIFCDRNHFLHCKLK